MPSFEISADIFTHLSVSHLPKGSSNTIKTHKNINLYLKRRHLKIYNSLLSFKNGSSCPVLNLMSSFGILRDGLQAKLFLSFVDTCLESNRTLTTKIKLKNRGNDNHVDSRFSNWNCKFRQILCYIMS